MFKCKICDKEFEKMMSISKHINKLHKLKLFEYYLKHILIQETIPKCKCGCNEKVSFCNIEKGFNEYKRGHISKICNNWGHNENAIKKSIETRQNNARNGTSPPPWNKGLTIEDPRVKRNIDNGNTPEKARKISIALKGKPKSKQHKKIIAEKLKKILV